MLSSPELQGRLSDPLESYDMASLEMNLFSPSIPTEINTSVRSISFGSILSGGVARDQSISLPDVAPGLYNIDDLLLTSSPKNSFSVSSNPVSNFQLLSSQFLGEPSSERLSSLPLELPAMEATSRFASIRDLESSTVLPVCFSVCNNSSPAIPSQSSSCSSSFAYSCTSIKEEKEVGVDGELFGLVSASRGPNHINPLLPSDLHAEGRGGVLQCGFIRNLPASNSTPMTDVCFLSQQPDKTELSGGVLSKHSPFSMFDTLDRGSSSETLSGVGETAIASQSLLTPPSSISSPPSSPSSNPAIFADEWEMEPKCCRRKPKNRKKWQCSNCRYRNNLSMFSLNVFIEYFR